MENKGWDRGTWLGLIGIAIGVIGLALSYYFYVLSIKEKEPIFLEDSQRTVIVEASSIKNFPLKIVKRDGNPVEKDISSVRFYFWNAGKEPIKLTEILQPISVELSSQDIQIIDYKITGSSRPNIVRPKINLTENKGNSINLSFDILEENDGFSVQLLYAGARNADLVIKGTIEGVNQIQTSTNLSSYHFYKTIFLLIGLPISGMFITLLVMFFVKPSGAKVLIPPLAFLADDIMHKKSFRIIMVISLILPMFIFPFIIYKEEKTEIQKRTYESMQGIVPNSIKQLQTKE